MFSFSNADKVLVVAPHPDDESLGTGGLLQRVFAQKIPVRILFATNGENNPWAQRYWERRWRIGHPEQVRWGQRRREEALNAIRSLGGPPECAKFLDLPDLGTSGLLMQSGEFLDLMVNEIREWEPTVALLPAMFDAHPDHSALAVAFSMALELAGAPAIRSWEYLVHRPQVPVPQKPIAFQLHAAEVERKRRAILCHETQVALSRKRFTSFAKIEETYYPRSPKQAIGDNTSLGVGRLREGILTFQFEVSFRERFHPEILFVVGSGLSCHRWRLSVPLTSGNAQVWDTVDSRRLHQAMVLWSGRRLSINIPMVCPPDSNAIYVKLSGRTLFFDRAGGNQFFVPVSREASAIRQVEEPRLVTLS
jgi:LmbE family N-acetylglucosaminyl deacetylase